MIILKNWKITLKKKPSRDKVVEYKMNGSNEWKWKIMNTQPKSTGKYNYWLNIIPEVENGDSVCLNCEQVVEWRELSQESHGVNPPKFDQGKDMIDAFQ